MKKIMTIVFVGLCTSLFAQVQIDKVIQLTGGTGERMITNLEPPVNGTDAVNKDYVDAAVAASGGSVPTEITDESSTTMNFQDAVYYCRDLTTGGNLDWRLPTFSDLMAILGADGVVVANNTSANTFWLMPNTLESSTVASRWRFDYGLLYTTNLASTSNLYYTRCVR